MIPRDSFYSFLEGNHDYLLVVDDQERILHLGGLLGQGTESPIPLEGLPLKEALTRPSLQSFRTAMHLARRGERSRAIFTPMAWSQVALLLSCGRTESTRGDLYVFFDLAGGGEPEAPTKELACLYAISEWIQVSPTLRDFFARLPQLLARGLRHPEKALVHAVYDGQSHGEPSTDPPTEMELCTRIVVNGETKGTLCIGYSDPTLSLLPEEQRMLDEIGHLLSLAIERKELHESLELKQEEEADHTRRLTEMAQEIALRQQDLDDQRKKLASINSYLERLTRDWEESRYRLETIFKGIPNPVAIIDRDRTLILTNHAHFEPGAKCYQTFFQREAPCRDCRLARIIREKTPITLTITHDGRFMEVHAIPTFDKNNEVDGIMEFYRDVTLERTYEQQLRQADRLASLGQLVSGIGHEINNPNQFIRGNIRIIQQAFTDILPILDAHHAAHPDLMIARLKYDFFRRHIGILIEDMAHGSERIKGIVEGLRRFARRDEGQLIDTVDINTLVEACRRLVYNEVHKTADIRLELAPDLPTFTGNSQKIEQVLVNLLVNAAQAVADDRRGLIVVRTHADRGSLFVEVVDNGRGMNEKTAEQIFDPFFTTKRASGGTGLGLAIAYRIIEEHNGTIQVQSRVGEGTTFTVRIPCGVGGPRKG